jgi:pimeloyl-ACP methyl ester carboxylesterase
MATSSWQKSTIDRSINRRAFRLLAGVAPPVAARLAERMWFTLPQAARGDARLRGDSDTRLPIRELLAAPFEVGRPGRVVRGWVWGDGPVVYLVHGWGGTLEQLTPLVGPLLEHGLRVVAFDGPSHGRSDPGGHGRRSSDAVELGRALDTVAARFGPARAVVAHSLGALSTLLAIRDGWLGTERLVLVAPMTGVPDVMARLRERLGFGDHVERRLAARAERRTGYAVDDLVVARLSGQIDRPPLLVVHDLLDREVPHSPSAQLVADWPGAELYSTAGLGHRRVLADAAVAGAIARFAARLPVEASLHGGEQPQPLPLPLASATEVA